MPRTIVLDGRRMTDRDHLYTYLEEKLDTPKYFGKNLDALWDVLSELPRSTRIFLVHPDDMLDQLGKYGSQLLRVFRDAHQQRRLYFYPFNEDATTL